MASSSRLRPWILLFCVFSTTGLASRRPDFTLASSSQGEKNDAERYLKSPPAQLNPACYRLYQPLLSIDGGGLRGILGVEVLIVVEEAIKQILVERPDVWSALPSSGKPISGSEFEIDLADYFSAIAGVNTGSWIAAYIASKGGNGASKRVFDDTLIVKTFGYIRPGSIEGLRVLFLHYARTLYSGYTIPISIIPRFLRLPDVRLAGINCPLFTVRGLEITLDLFLGRTFLSQVATTLLIHTYDIDQKATVLYMADKFIGTGSTRTVVFRNEPEPRVSQNPETSVDITLGKDYFLTDLARASSASPTVFEAKRFSAVNDHSFSFYGIDGSMMTNNPTLMASYFLLNQQRISNQQIMSIISIGLGISIGHYRQHGNDGALQWFVTTQDFIQIMMSGGSEFVQTQFHSIYYESYERFDTGYIKDPTYLRVQAVYDQRTPEGEGLSRMHDYRNVEAMQLVGKITGRRFKNDIDHHVRDFVVPEKCAPTRQAVEQKLKEKGKAKEGPETTEPEEPTEPEAVKAPEPSSEASESEKPSETTESPEKKFASLSSLFGMSGAS